MEWIQLIVLIATLGALFLWNRSESRSDYRETNALIAAIQQDMKDFHQKMADLRKEYQDEMKELRKDFYQEARDFHGRLTIVEKNKS